MRSKIFILGIFLSLDLWGANLKRKSIDFEDTLVEGVNRQPLDSLNQLNEEREYQKIRLYKKRGGYKDLKEETLEEMRNLP